MGSVGGKVICIFQVSVCNGHWDAILDGSTTDSRNVADSCLRAGAGECFPIEL